MWPCIQIIREQSRMCNQLVLGPLQTDCLLGILMASAQMLCPKTAGGSVCKYIPWLCTAYMERVLTALVTAGACEL